MTKARPLADLDAGAATSTQSQRLLTARSDELLALATAVRDPSNVEALHNLRIAGKRLRYALAGFAPCLGAELPATLRQLEDLQDRLGAIRDLDVSSGLLRDELRLAIRRLRATRKRLDAHQGATEALADDAVALARALRQGEAIGLVELVGQFAQRRRTLFVEFLLFWDELLAGGFVAQVRRLVE